MAHFAELDENNIVLRVIVVADQYEADGENWCHNLIGGRWKQTSYNSRIRKNYAGIGFVYDEQRDAFIAPKPYNSWLLNEETCKWEPPTPMPLDENSYDWDESSLSWVLVERPQHDNAAT